MRTLLVLALVACGASSSDERPTHIGATPAGGPTWAIQLERPPEIGRSYRVQTSAHSRQAQTLIQDGERRGGVDEKRVSLVGVMQRTGELTYWVDVESLEVTIGESVQRPISSGTRIEVTRGEPGIIAMNGQPLTGDLEEWVGLVVADGPPRDEDELYGTRERQPIGGTWNFAPDVVSELLERMHVRVPAAEIHGGLQVVRLEEQPVEALRIRGVLEMDTLDFPGMPDATVESGNVRVAMEWLTPTEPNRVSPFRSMEMTMNATLQIRDPETGDSGTLQMEISMQREATLEPME